MKLSLLKEISTCNIKTVVYCEYTSKFARKLTVILTCKFTSSIVHSLVAIQWKTRDGLKK